MGKKKKEFSSDSDSSRPKKHKKSSKKSKHKKKKRRHSSTSESEEWIEKKNNETNSSPKHNRDRDLWMDNFCIPTFSKDKQQLRAKDKVDTVQNYDPSNSKLELNPFYKDGGSGMPNFKRPDDDEDFEMSYRKATKSSDSSGNWRKTVSLDRLNQKIRSRSNSPSGIDDSKMKNLARTSSKTDSMGVLPKPSDFLTDQQMNEIGAKMIKAEMLGNKSLYEKLKAKLDHAKAVKNAPSEKESVVLTITNASGTCRPAKQDELSQTPNHDKKRKTKRIETHVSGERTQYYPDDGRYDIKQMVRFNKRIVNKKDNNLFCIISVRVGAAECRF